MDIAYIGAVALVLVVQQVLIVSALEENCKRLSIRSREKQCNPTLGAVTTQILASDGSNFTQVCRSVEAYVQCMEPSILSCEPSSVLEYWQNKLTYTSEPYNCTPTLSTVHNMSWTDDNKYHPIEKPIMRRPQWVLSGGHSLDTCRIAVAAFATMAVLFWARYSWTS